MGSSIIVEKTPYHKYAFTFDFSKKTLEYCRYLKATLGWKEFAFSDGKWRFSDPAIIYMLKDRYPEVVFDKEVSDEIARFKDNRDRVIEQERKAKEIKETRIPM